MEKEGGRARVFGAGKDRGMRAEPTEPKRE